MQPTVTEYARHNAARVFDGHKKTTFDCGLLGPGLFGVEGPAFVFCEGGHSIRRWRGYVNNDIMFLFILMDGYRLV